MNESTPHPGKYDLPKTYEFAEVEQRWYTHWLDEKTFSARMDQGKPSFSISASADAQFSSAVTPASELVVAPAG